MSVEGFFRNFQKTSESDNYEKYRAQSAELFLSCDQNEIAAKPGVDSDRVYFYITFTGSIYRVSRETAAVEVLNSSSAEYSQAGFNESLIIYDLLAFAVPDAHPSGEYTQIQNLSDMLTSSSYAGKGMFDEIAQRFVGREDRLANACRTLGGEPYGKGDVSYRIPLTDDLGAVVSFWSADDEFPASLNLLCDKNTRSYLHYETIWYLAGCLFSKIEKLMD